MPNEKWSRNRLRWYKNHNLPDHKIRFVVADILSTALSLMDENDKMKAEIEELKGRVIEAHDEGVEDGMKAVMSKVEKLIDKIKNKVTREDEILQDLVNIMGVEK